MGLSEVVACNFRPKLPAPTINLFIKVMECSNIAHTVFMHLHCTMSPFTCTRLSQPCDNLVTVQQQFCDIVGSKEGQHLLMCYLVYRNEALASEALSMTYNERMHNSA